MHSDEIAELNRIVSMWLDFAEDQAQRRKQVFLQDWQQKLDQFLSFNDRDVLTTAGSITKKAADQKAKDEYEVFAETQRRLKEDQGAHDSIEALLEWQKNDNDSRPK